MECEQRLGHRLGDQFPDFKFTVESHFALGRMNVHVDGSGIHFDNRNVTGYRPFISAV